MLIHDPNVLKAYTALKPLRDREDLKLKPCPFFRKTIAGSDGSEKPLSLRPYQAQMVAHLNLMSRFVVGDDTGLGKCCRYDTLVLTDRGLIPIGEIEDWDRMGVDTFKPLSKPLSVYVGGVARPVKSFYYGGVKPTITVTSNFRFQITGSRVHPLLVYKGGEHRWVEARNLREGDHLCIDRAGTPFPASEAPVTDNREVGISHVTPDFARFLGYYVGGGSLLARGHIQISQCPKDNPEAHRDIIRLMGTLFGKSPAHLDRPDLCFDSPNARQFLADNGLHYCPEEGREIPPCILQSNEHSCRAFIRALMDAHAGPSGLEYRTSSEKLGVQLQIMLLGFGVVSSRTPKEGKEGLTSWRLAIREQDTDLFWERIGSAHTRALPRQNTKLDMSCEPGGLASAQWFYDPIVSLEEGEDEVFDVEVDDPEHAFIGNGIVNHNTFESIAGLCYHWMFEPEMMAIVVTTKSATDQWGEEFHKFTVGVNVFTVKGGPKKRAQILDEFDKASFPKVAVMGYGSAKRDQDRLINYTGYALILDEATTFKNPKSQVHKICERLSRNAKVCWGLTATLLKNNLMEGYGIFKVIVPGLFSTQNSFMKEYCITQLQAIPGTRHKVLKIIGYRAQDIAMFKARIDPYFLGRGKMTVAGDLPVLISQNIMVDMNKKQVAKYLEAMDGLLVIGEKGPSRNADGEMTQKALTKLSALIYCQQISNHLDLIGCEGGSSKLDKLVEMLTQGDLAEEKVILFTRFRKMVDLAVPVLEKLGVRCVRVTGSEKEAQRQDAKKRFQDPDSGIRVCWITMAGSEAINLQAAKALIFYDTPWSGGDYLQILGRMIRIGSQHDRCLAYHLIARNSIDGQVMKVLRKKMVWIEAVIGKRVEGGDFKTAQDIKTINEVDLLFEVLRKAAAAHKG